MPEEGDDPAAEQADVAQGAEVKGMSGDEEKEEGGSDPVENEAEELISPKTSACSKNCSLGRVVKGLVTIGVIALLYVFQNEVSKQIASARDDIKKLPAVPVVLITLVVNTLRFCFPPLYYTVPYTALFAFWSADTLVSLTQLAFHLLKHSVSFNNMIFFTNSIRVFTSGRLRTKPSRSLTCFGLPRSGTCIKG